MHYVEVGTNFSCGTAKAVRGVAGRFAGAAPAVQQRRNSLRGTRLRVGLVAAGREAGDEVEAMVSAGDVEGAIYAGGGQNPEWKDLRVHTETAATVVSGDLFRGRSGAVVGGGGTGREGIRRRQGYGGPGKWEGGRAR